MARETILVDKNGGSDASIGFRGLFLAGKKKTQIERIRELVQMKNANLLADGKLFIFYEALRMSSKWIGNDSVIQL